MGPVFYANIINSDVQKRKRNGSVSASLRHCFSVAIADRPGNTKTYIVTANS